MFDYAEERGERFDWRGSYAVSPRRSSPPSRNHIMVCRAILG
jgi:hypothetical protein